MTDDTILLHGPSEMYEVRKEGRANGTITPGRVLDYGGNNTDGPTTERNFTEHDTDAVRPRHIALEQSYAGRGIDDEYSSGDALVYAILRAGMEVQAFVFDGSNAAGSGTDLSANANISVGDKLVGYSGGGETGCLRAFDGDNEGAVVAEATEAVNNSAEASPARINVEVV